MSQPPSPFYKPTAVDVAKAHTARIEQVQREADLHNMKVSHRNELDEIHNELGVAIHLLQAGQTQDALRTLEDIQSNIYRSFR